MPSKRFTLDFILIFLVVEIIIFEIFLNSGFLAGTDAVPYTGQVSYLSKDFRWLHAWRTFDLGFPENIRGLDFFLIPTTLALGNAILAIKLFVFTSFILAGISMHRLVYHHTHSYNASLFAGIIYILNQSFQFEYTETHIDIIFSYAFIPLIFLYVDKALTTGKLRDCTLLALCSTIFLVFFHFQMTYIYAFFMPLLFISYILFPENRSRFHLLKRTVKILILTGSLTFLMAAFFFIPAITGSSSPFIVPGHPARTWPVEVFAQQLHRFVLSVINFIPLTFLLIPVSIVAFFSYNKKHVTIFFILSGFIAAFMAKGLTYPFPEVYGFILQNIPYAASVRYYWRWFLIAMLSYSFLLGILVLKLESVIGKITSRNMSDGNLIMRNINFIKKLVVQKNLSTLLIISILISSSVNAALCGLGYIGYDRQTYTPQEMYVNPIEWIGTVPGEYRVTEVSQFGFGEVWITPGIIGTGYRDFGSDSYYFHDKAVIQTGGWVPLAEEFFEFIRYSGGVMKTGNLGKVLGAFNVRYIILPPYAQPDWVINFKNQKNVNLVLDYSGTEILENELWSPRIFASSKYGLVVGGRETMLSLLQIPNYSLNKYALIFADQNDFFSLMDDSDSLIFSDGTVLDEAFLLLDDEYVNSLDKYVKTGFTRSASGMSDAGIDRGKLVLYNPIYKVTGLKEVTVPFTVRESGEYEVWLRLVFEGWRGAIRVYVDGELIQIIRPLNYRFKFDWVKLGSFQLNEGVHKIVLENDGTGTNEMDAIAIVPEQVLDSNLEEIVNKIENYNGRIIILKEAEDLFKDAIPYHFDSSNGFVAELTANDTSTINIPKSSDYMIGIRIQGETETGKLEIELEDQNMSIPYRSSSYEPFDWLEVGPFHLDSGEKKFSLGPSGLIVDEIIFYSLKNGEKDLSLTEIFDSSHTPTTSFEQLSPTQYKVDVNSSEPFILTLSYAYHPKWRAYIESEYKPLISYSFANSFIINEEGEINVELHFLGQYYTVIGLAISAAAIILAIAYIAITSENFKKIRHRSNRTQPSRSCSNQE